MYKPITAEGRLHDLGNGRAKQQGVNHGARDGNHGQSSVKNLLFLAKLDCCRIGIFELTAIKAKVTRFAIGVVLVKGKKLNSGHSQKDLHVHAKTDGINGTKDILVGVRISWEMNAGLLH
jgi:hypothetical protein